MKGLLVCVPLTIEVCTTLLLVDPVLLNSFVNVEGNVVVWVEQD
jgi:hypothetical protein